MRSLLIVAFTVILAGCGSKATSERQAEAAKPSEKPAPPDESRRFPKANLTRTEVVHDDIWDKPFMPGGTVAYYRRGVVDYQMFVARMPNATDAAIGLNDWRKALPDAKLVPSFGGYYGSDGGRPVFVFPKGEWLAGIRGLNQKEADAQARVLAAQLY
jgi:hypothetical protein